MDEIAYTAPPTGANLGPGFDVLGVAYSDIRGDTVIARRARNSREAKIVQTRGPFASLVSDF